LKANQNATAFFEKSKTFRLFRRSDAYLALQRLSGAPAFFRHFGAYLAPLRSSGASALIWRSGAHLALCAFLHLSDPKSRIDSSALIRRPGAHLALRHSSARRRSSTRRRFSGAPALFSSLPKAIQRFRALLNLLQILFTASFLVSAPWAAARRQGPSSDLCPRNVRESRSLSCSLPVEH